MVIGGAFPELSDGVVGEPASVDAIAGNVETFARGATLHPLHSSAGLAHSFALIERTTGNPLERRIVRREGSVVGWYVYEQRPDRTARALHVAAPRSPHAMRSSPTWWRRPARPATRS